MTDQPSFRLAELIAALSLATDLGTGQPMEHALRTCLLSVRLAPELGLDDEQRRDLYYVALLRSVGCSADAHEAAALSGGDELAFRALMAPVFMGEKPELLGQLMRHLGAGEPAPRRLRLLLGALADPHGLERTIAAHCEAARRLAAWLRLPEPVQQALGHAFERWDGQGFPAHLTGERIPLPARIALVARDVELLSRAGGIELMTELLSRRRGRAYDPAIADAFLVHGARLLGELEPERVWEAVLEEEPAPRERVGEGRLDGVLGAFAAFADLQSLFLSGHSQAVAELARRAATRAGLGASEAALLRRAGLLHDLGRIGVPNGIWDKPASLTPAERERVRLHPYLTERVLSRCPALGPLATLAASHHERLDGSGYHRGLPAPLLSPGARLLAAADAYQAMTEPRAYRPALSPGEATEQLRAEVRAGRLDRAAVAAVLSAAGQQAGPLAGAWPAGLSDREVDVLRLIIRGLPNRAVAQQLNISAKTVGHHVEHIYAKIGVSTRAGAALFAMEHDLLQG